MSNGNGQQAANGNTGAIVRSAADKRKGIELALVNNKKSWSAMLPKHVQADVMLRSTMAAIAQTPALLGCTHASIVMSVAQACALGLPPNTPLGLGYLVPYKDTCTFIPGYRGLIRLAIQSGEVQSIEARAVFARDAFEIHMGTSPRIDHSPSLDADRGEWIGVYAVAKLKSGETMFEWMSIGEVRAIRDRSKAKNDGPWVTDEVAMAMKTVIRKLCKYLPLSEEKLGRALELQAAAESGVPDFSDVVDTVGEVVESAAEQPAQSRTEAMKDRVAAKVEAS